MADRKGFSVCLHEWVVLRGGVPEGMDYCKKCKFLGSKHLTAIVGAVGDTVRLMSSLNGNRNVLGKDLIKSFEPGKPGWLVCTIFQPEALILSWLGRKKVLIGIDEAIAAGTIVRRRGERGQFSYVPGQPDDLQTRKLVLQWRKHQPMLCEIL